MLRFVSGYNRWILDFLFRFSIFFFFNNVFRGVMTKWLGFGFFSLIFKVRVGYEGRITNGFIGFSIFWECSGRRQLQQVGCFSFYSCGFFTRSLGEGKLLSVLKLEGGFGLRFWVVILVCRFSRVEFRLLFGLVVIQFLDECGKNVVFGFLFRRF